MEDTVYVISLIANTYQRQTSLGLMHKSHYAVISYGPYNGSLRGKYHQECKSSTRIDMLIYM